MHFRTAFLGFCVVLGACASTETGTDIAKLNEGVEEAATALRTADFKDKVDKQSLERADFRRRSDAARSTQVRLSENCNDAITRRFDTGISNCRIVRKTTSAFGRTKVEAISTPSFDADRKLNVLSNYVEALVALSESKTEEDIVNSFAAASDAIGNLGDASKSSELTKFAKSLKEEREKVDAVASFAVRQLRARKVKQLVLKSDAAVGKLTREIHSKYVAGGDAAQFDTLVKAMSDADSAATTSYSVMVATKKSGDATAISNAEQSYANAIKNLEDAHAAFVSKSAKTPIGKLYQVAITHHALAKRLRNPASLKETVNFLKELKQLSDSLKKG